MGAAIISSRAAARSGVGYVQLVSVPQACEMAVYCTPEIITVPLQEGESGSIAPWKISAVLECCKKATAILLGCGLGNNKESYELVKQVLKKASCPVVLDADGINILAEHIDILKESAAELILTPHPGEMGRLTGQSAAKVNESRLAQATNFAKEYGVTVVLKGYHTIVAASSGEIYLNFTGNPGLAKAGSGDALAGIIGSLAAQGLAPHIAAACGVWLHGSAADVAAKRYSMAAMQPSDVIDCLSEIFLKLGR